MRVGITTSIATAIAIGVLVATSGGGSGANVFVSTTGNNGTCVRNDQTKPCLTLAQAVSIAQSGDVIEVAGAASPGGANGWYGCESISGTSKTLSVRAATGQYPWFACTNTLSGRSSDGYSLLFNTVSNFQMTGIYVAGMEWQASSNITLNNVTVTCNDDGTHFELWGGLCNAKIEALEVGDLTNFTMNGGSVGPTIDNEFGTYPGSSRMSGDNMTFVGTTFHDNRREPGGHSECLMIRGGDTISITKSKFLGCATISLFITCFPLTGGNSAPCLYANPPDNITLENNFFAAGDLGTSQVNIDCRDTNPTVNLTVRYNTFARGISGGTCAGQFKGNIVAYQGCGGNFTYTYNVWGDDIGRICGSSATNDSVASTGGTSDGAGYNATTGLLNAGSAAIGQGDPADFPATDINGDPRTSPPDAGSDER